MIFYIFIHAEIKKKKIKSYFYVHYNSTYFTNINNIYNKISYNHYLLKYNEIYLIIYYKQRYYYYFFFFKKK